MRVLYLTEEAISFDGALVRGGAIHVRQVVEGLRERGHDVHLIDWRGDGDRPYHHSLAPATRFVVGPAATYRRAVGVGRREGVDVVVSKTRKTYLPGLLAARRLGVPHAVHVGTLPEPAGDGLAARLDNASFVARLRLPHDGYLAVCEAVGEALHRRGVAPNRIHHVGNAVDVDRFHPDGTATLPPALADALPDGPLVGYVGGLHAYKGIADLAAAVDRATEPFSLVVTGDGPERAALRSRLDDRHVLLGAVDYAHMPALYRELDLLVLPSHTEGLPRVVLEAQASGTPVVATAVGGVPEVVEDGETGVLVPPRAPAELADGIDGLLADPDARVAMSAAARDRVVDAFDWPALYDRYEAALSSLRA